MDWFGIAAVITALGGVAVAIISTLRNHSATLDVQKGVDKVHEIVNQQRSDMMSEIATLKLVIQQMARDKDKAVIQAAADAAKLVLEEARKKASS